MQYLIANHLSGEFVSKVDFGCSDCDCSSHLFYCQNLESLDNAVFDSFIILEIKKP